MITKLTATLILALFFFLPFERIPTFEYQGFTIKISYIIATILILFLILFERIKIFQKSKLSNSDWFLILFWFSAVISTTVFGATKRNIILLFLWAFVFLLYFFLSRINYSKALITKIENVVLISTALVCIFGIFQFLGDSFGLSQSYTGLRDLYLKTVLGFPRIQSVGLEPLYFANFLLVPLFISLKRYIENKELLKPYFILSVLILINIILTISRGVYIAAGFSLLVLIIYLWFNRKKENYYNKIFGVAVIVIVSLLLSLVMIFKFNGKDATDTFLGHAVVEKVEADGSAFDRVSAYGEALKLWQKKPLFGIGIGNFGIITTSQKNIEKTGYTIVNNEYIELLTENGLIGLILFLGFLILLLKEIRIGYNKTNIQKKKLEIITLFLGLLAIFIQYNFFSTLYIIYIWVFLALLKGGINSEENLQ